MKSDRAMGVTFGPQTEGSLSRWPELEKRITCDYPLLGLKAMQKAAPVIDLTRRCPCCGGDGLQSYGFSAYSEVECVTECRTCDGRGYVLIEPNQRD